MIIKNKRGIKPTYQSSFQNGLRKVCGVEVYIHLSDRQDQSNLIFMNNFKTQRNKKMPDGAGCGIQI